MFESFLVKPMSHLDIMNIPCLVCQIFLSILFAKAICTFDTVGGIVNNTLRPPVPATCDPEWRRLMEQCWAPDPVHRPSFTQIAGHLRAMSVQAKPAKC